MVASRRTRQTQARACPAQNPAAAFARRASRLGTACPQPSEQSRCGGPDRRPQTRTTTLPTLWQQTGHDCSVAPRTMPACEPARCPTHGSATLKMTLLLSLFVLFEAQPPPTPFVRHRKPPASELLPTVLSRLTTSGTRAYSVFNSHGSPLGVLRARVHNREPNTFRIPPKPPANEPWAAPSFNPGM